MGDRLTDRSTHGAASLRKPHAHTRSTEHKPPMCVVCVCMGGGGPMFAAQGVAAARKSKRDGMERLT